MEIHVQKAMAKLPLLVAFVLAAFGCTETPTAQDESVQVVEYTTEPITWKATDSRVGMGPIMGRMPKGGRAIILVGDETVCDGYRRYIDEVVSLAGRNPLTDFVSYQLMDSVMHAAMKNHCSMAYTGREGDRCPVVHTLCSSREDCYSLLKVKMPGHAAPFD